MYAVYQDPLKNLPGSGFHRQTASRRGVFRQDIQKHFLVSLLFTHVPEHIILHVAEPAERRTRQDQAVDCVMYIENVYRHIQI